MWDGSTIIGALTPKFYVALTGTSSLISGLILIFEWWYFRKYGSSFIEQVWMTHLGPWLAGCETAQPPPSHNHHSTSDCKVWRNPMALLRGAEYGRLWIAVRRSALTYYDMNLSAQEHQAWFGCTSGGSDGAEEAMSRAWREREPSSRVAAARQALALRPDCAPALLLLAEEDAATVQEAERVLKRAWRAAESAVRAASGPSGLASGAEARRAAAVLAHVKRRAGMCLRRLGRLKDAARIFRELTRDAPPSLHALSLHENLIEVLLEQRAYPDVQAVLAKYEEAGWPQSATLLYTAALLRARAAGATAQGAGNGNGTPGGSSRGNDLAALEAMRVAISFNPYVAGYLLEQRSLTLPPEHVLRRGDSEAVAYAFAHLRHWKNAEPALRLLAAACQAAERSPWPLAPFSGSSCSRCADAELLPPHHVGLGRRPQTALPAALLCTLLALLALLAHRYTPAAQMDPRALLRLLADV